MFLVSELLSISLNSLSTRLRLTFSACLQRCWFQTGAAQTVAVKNWHVDGSRGLVAPCRPALEHLCLAKCEQDVWFFVSWVMAHSSAGTLWITPPLVLHLVGNSVMN